MSIYVNVKLGQLQCHRNLFSSWGDSYPYSVGTTSTSISQHFQLTVDPFKKTVIFSASRCFGWTPRFFAWKPCQNSMVGGKMPKRCLNSKWTINQYIRHVGGNGVLLSMVWWSPIFNNHFMSLVGIHLDVYIYIQRMYTYIHILYIYICTHTCNALCIYIYIILHHSTSIYLYIWDSCG